MSGPGRLRDRVADAVRDHALWKAEDSVVVAVSGGHDSVALLDLLRATTGRHRGRISAVTVDHGTHDASSEHADAVVERCAGWAVGCTRVSLDLGSAASEDACRRARYAAFDALDCDRVALAHHRDDQAETVLLQLLRGAGSRGLSAMRWRRGRYVRPLLGVSREELGAWSAHRELAWAEDPTNSDPRFLRNRVRGELMPLLEELRPGAAATLARSARILGDEDALLELLALDAPVVPGESIPTSVVTALHPALARRVLRDWARGASAAHIDGILQIVARGSGSVRLGGEREVKVSGGRLVIDE